MYTGSIPPVNTQVLLGTTHGGLTHFLLLQLPESIWLARGWCVGVPCEPPSNKPHLPPPREAPPQQQPALQQRQLRPGSGQPTQMDTATMPLDEQELLGQPSRWRLGT